MIGETRLGKLGKFDNNEFSDIIGTVLIQLLPDLLTIARASASFVDNARRSACSPTSCNHTYLPNKLSILAKSLNSAVD